MTVTTTTNRSTTTGTGADTAIPINFDFYDSSSLIVVSRVIDTGVETIMTETTHYTVSGGSGTTGTVTVVDGATNFPTTVEWTIYRAQPQTQASQYVASDSFASAGHEDIVDKIVMNAQDNEERLDRSVHFPVSDDSSLSSALPNSVDRASNYLAFNASGEPIAADAPTDTSVTSAFGASLIDDADGDAALITLGLTATAAEINTSLDGCTATAAELNALDGVTSAVAELNLLDGSGVANSTASKAVCLDSDKRVASTATAGTEGTNVSAVEYSGDGLNFTTILTLTNVAATIGDNVNLAGGELIYTFPAGALVVNGATMSVGITATDAANAADTPELGVGTLVGSGANATLGAVDGDCENIVGPGNDAAAADCTGTAALLTDACTLKVDAADAHTVYCNYADGWADNDDQTASLSGTVVINWSRLPLS